MVCVCQCVCVCEESVWERVHVCEIVSDRKNERKRERVMVCVCGSMLERVRVCKRERERVCVRVGKCVFKRERVRERKRGEKLHEVHFSLIKLSTR